MGRRRRRGKGMGRKDGEVEWSEKERGKGRKGKRGQKEEGSEEKERGGRPIVISKSRCLC